MALNSYTFILLFLPLAFSGHCVALHYGSRPMALRVLLFTSFAFYAVAGVLSVALIGLSTIGSYLAAKAFLATPPIKTRARKLIIITAIATDVLFLCYFKYSNLLVDTANTLTSSELARPSMYLPLGLSFLTFQKIGFLSDLRSGQIKEVRGFDFALFCLFFPRAVAGPIVRYKDFMAQVAGIPAAFRYTDVAVGLCLLAIGLFKEAVIASIAAKISPNAFGPRLGQHVPLLSAWTGALGYTFQLYFEFSGYSDMALGAARLFGIRLPMNFNSPFKARSLIDFWGRWHITLTRFLTWQIYIPLVRHITHRRAVGGKSTLKGRDLSASAVISLIGFPTLITMTISGAWHGAGWTYVVWGVMHGVFLTLNQMWKLWKARLFRADALMEQFARVFGRLATLVIVVCAMVVFRAESLSTAVVILKGMFGMSGVLPWELELTAKYGFPVDGVYFLILTYWYPLVCLAVMLAIVSLLPNSLELLRRFSPASDFPSNVDASVATPTPMASRQRELRATRVRLGWDSALGWLRTVKCNGLSLGLLAAGLFALFLVLGIAAIDRSGPFIYGQF